MRLEILIYDDGLDRIKIYYCIDCKKAKLTMKEIIEHCECLKNQKLKQWE